MKKRTLFKALGAVHVVIAVTAFGYAVQLAAVGDEAYAAPVAFVGFICLLSAGCVLIRLTAVPS